jgi:hypothetical protein
MKKRTGFIKKVILMTGASLLLLLGSPVVLVSAQGSGVNNFAATAKEEVCAGLGATGGSGCGTDGAALSNIIKLAVNVLSLLVGVAAVIMIIIGGFKYITSQGEAANTASAKNTIFYAIIGLVVVALAQFIVRFTLARAGDASLGCKPTQKIDPATGKCV